MSSAVFTQDGRWLRASELARGPWDPDAQHGGAPAALLMRAFERLEADPRLLLSRVTYELLRPVPVGALEVRAEVVRSGRRVQLLEGSIVTDAGVEVVRARGLRVRGADVGGSPAGSASGGSQGSAPGPGPPGPEHGRPNDFEPHGRSMFATDAIEIRFVAGRFYEPGPATAWFRLRAELVAGETPTPLQRLAAAGDFGNGISTVLPWESYVFINPDLTLYVEREPVGEWIGLDSETRLAPGGIGIAESVLYDERGRVGRATQALLVAPAPT